jgi:hypothetical protein
MCSCSIRHAVEKDYPEYLAKNSGTSTLPRTDKASEYFLTPQTQEFSYEFRAFVTGAANLWVVDFGKMLDDTLQSADVQAAFGDLERSDDVAASDAVLIFDLHEYTFEEFGAHISLNIALSRANEVVFEKTYTEDGRTQGGKMFWGGAFAQKNAVQQSTRTALDEILRQLIADLNART